MEILVILIVITILYFIGKNYKTEEFVNINLKRKDKFEGDLSNHEAGLLISLMAKVAKADGRVCELEAELLKHTFNDIASHFENSDEIRDKLKALYAKEKESFDNMIIICEKLYSLTRNDYTKRIKIMEYLLNLAFIDKEFSNTEKMITEDISNALKIRIEDFDNMIKTFKTFYAQQASSKAISLEKAYEILESNISDDAATLKKNYRTLVKKYHPDIIIGQGASQNIIDDATKKLQEINEAYEMIKKDKGL
ncbi:MAG: TerB family tellurite resistance protein [Aliarcobacter sp.]|nr:TerB family tellurite resistance protein [Aliarcobacter sp.]MBP7225354.1 TerB family tellurite resistance protein [Aliarcobacter sp.]